ncbi:ArsA family ATPase [Streptomyces sp. NPDC057638]|uniref:ArsA family ATPase n=1 Tax=Streptomyces sp. NPDC057638 TaxID=3346190 RepID=UPI00368DC217
MRTVLVTGLGGAGRTTMAAATALAAAARVRGTSGTSAPCDRGTDTTGRRVLLLSPDALPATDGGAPLTAVPTPVAEGLWAARIDPAADFRAEFLSLQEHAGPALDLLGARAFADEELTPLPGSDQFSLLRALLGARSGDWDLVVADLPPLPETIALLALPEQLRRYLRRLLPPERQAARALRPVLAQLAGVPMPARWLYETAARRDEELADLQRLLGSPGLTLRVVAEPGPGATDALRTARTGLALHGLRVETLIANRVLPRHSADPFLADLAARQEKTVGEWDACWSPGTALREVPHTGREPRTWAALAELAPLVGDATATDSATDGTDATDATDSATDGTDSATDATATATDATDATATGWPVEDRRAAEGILVWAIPLPGAVKGEVGLVRRGDELLLTVGRFRRIVPLPSALRRCAVTGAGLVDGTLRVRFTPDPGLWPRES